MKKSSKGFTLIELLAVIVILAVIALIATPIVLNIINNSKNDSTVRSGELYIDAVENAIAKAQLNGTEVSSGTYTINSDGNLSCTSEYQCSVSTIVVEASGTKPDSGTIIIEKGKVVPFLSSDKTSKTLVIIGGIKIAYNIDGKLEEVSTSSGWKLTKDKGNKVDGLAEKGDLITIKTESFYVISNDGINIKALAKYNLYVGANCTYDDNTHTYNFDEYGIEATGMQDSSMLGSATGDVRKGITTFSSDTLKATNYADYTGSIVEKYVNEYKIKLEKLGVTVNNASLIKREELETLGCNFQFTSCGDAPLWVYSTSYWTESAAGPERVFFVDSRSEFRNTIYTDFNYGVRPVITISTSEI